MNRKKSKRIKLQSSKIIVTWLRSILSEEEADKVNLKTFRELLPEQTHFYGGGKFLLNAYTERWTQKKIKQALKILPTVKLEDLTINHLLRKVEG